MNNKDQLLYDIFSAEIEEINQRKILSKDGYLRCSGSAQPGQEHY